MPPKQLRGERPPRRTWGTEPQLRVAARRGLLRAGSEAFAEGAGAGEVGRDHRAHVVLERGPELGRAGRGDQGAVEHLEQVLVLGDLRAEVGAVDQGSRFVDTAGRGALLGVLAYAQRNIGNAALLVRQGRRVAPLRVLAWQDDRSRPVASATVQFLVG